MFETKHSVFFKLNVKAQELWRDIKYIVMLIIQLFANKFDLKASLSSLYVGFLFCHYLFVSVLYQCWHFIPLFLCVCMRAEGRQRRPGPGWDRWYAGFTGNSSEYHSESFCLYSSLIQPRSQKKLGHCKT